MDSSTQEFLPLCDVLFNIISLGAYFCDVVFDFVAIYWLQQEGYDTWFTVCLSCVLFSLVTSQIISLAWFLSSFKLRNENKYVVSMAEQQPDQHGLSRQQANVPYISQQNRTDSAIHLQRYERQHTRSQSNSNSIRCKPGFVCEPSKLECDVWFTLFIHVIQAGVLWRYFKLFIPVDLRYVKQEVRDLCLLRLVHAFCEAAPMLLVQLYLIWHVDAPENVPQSSIVSAILSLVNIAWALASFNKHVRKRDLHRLVLTWLGVIFQFLWRLGTVFSRAVALTLYASLYHYWLFLVIVLHWFSMLLWLLSPKNVFSKEKISWYKKVIYSSLIAFMYVFCYVNLQNTNASQKMAAFYITMFLENTLLVSVWLGQKAGAEVWYQNVALLSVWGGFIAGMIWMILYYKYFHISRLKHAQMALRTGTLTCPNCKAGSCAVHSVQSNIAYSTSAISIGDPANVVFNSHLGGVVNTLRQNGAVAYVPGVFNCKLNPAFKRKKKKPTSFVPPPAPQYSYIGAGKMDVPFWKQPLPPCIHSVSSSDHERSIGYRVDIQEKLQEKKRQQLQKLLVIEEEIKQGKLQRPHLDEISEAGTLRQPIPHSKKQPRLARQEEPGSRSYCLPSRPNMEYTRLRQYTIVQKKHRPQTPEVILAPQYLEQGCYDQGSIQYNQRWRNRHPSDSSNISSVSCHRPNFGGSRQATIYKSYRDPSDIDSQVSLPRSYTLPRQFRYKQKARKVIRTDHVVPSTNSSDGDVDSADDELDSGSEKGLPQLPQRTRMLPMCDRRRHHETKL